MNTYFSALMSKAPITFIELAVLLFIALVYYIISTVCNRKLRVEKVTTIFSTFLEHVKKNGTLDTTNPDLQAFFAWDYNQAIKDFNILSYSIQEYLNEYIKRFNSDDPIHVYRSVDEIRHNAEVMFGVKA